MTQEAEELYRAVAALPEIERAELVVLLLESIAPADCMFASHADERRDRLAAARADSVEILDDGDAGRLVSG